MNYLEIPGGIISVLIAQIMITVIMTGLIFIRELAGFCHFGIETKHLMQATG